MNGHFDKPLMPGAQFARRLVSHILMTLALVVLSLGIGIAGYMRLEHLSFLDAFLNASMLLGGMGPVTTPLTSSGKIFAGFYALYAGLVFLISASFVLAPVAHRILHSFHLDGEDEK